MLPISFTPQAHVDILQSVVRIEQYSPGRGFKFEAELQLLLNRIQRTPYIGQQVSPLGIRRRRLLSFKYYVLYHVDSDHIMVLGVLHEQQDSHVMKSRIEQFGNGAL